MTTRTEAAARFSPTLAAYTPFADNEIEWPNVRLRVRGYAAGIEVPDIMVSSVRAVVFKGSRVVVVRESNGPPHITPGGRREPGETLEETCRREVAEESGWRIGPLRPFALYHFQHLNPAPPPDFPFEWCDFLNLVYLAEGAGYDRRLFDRSQEQLGARLMSARAARSVLPPEQLALLDEALKVRRLG